MSDLLTTGGHLSELTLDRLLYEPVLPAELRSAIDGHLEGCSACRDTLAAMRAFDAEVALAPPRRPATPPAAARTGRLAWLGALTGLAAAAAIALVLAPTGRQHVVPGGDGLRLRGSTFSVGFYVHDGERSRRVESGDAIHPGERVGFQVAATDGGHLLIVGIDETLEPYLCFPQEAGGRSALLGAHREPETLGQAMEFDSLLGHERLVALLCPEPVSLDDFRGRLVEAARSTDPSHPLPQLVPRCAQRDIVLNKR